MSKFKRISAFLIACTMVFGLIGTFTFAADVNESIKGTKFEEPVELLKALDIMVGDAETGDLRLEDGILRSEFAKIAVHLSGLSEVAASSQGGTRFPDVVENHWATGYINVAAQQGYVIGDDYGNFRPDDQITYDEAVTVIVRILGYEPRAASSGGFPTGYTVVAGQIGLLRNGVVASGSNVGTTRGTVAIMSFNSLTIDIMEKTSYGANENYEVVNKNILKEKLDVTKEYGQVTATYLSTLTGTSSLREDEVSILSLEGETNTYKTGTTDAVNYLAKNVIYYVRDLDNNTDPTLILVRNNANRNTEIKVPADHISSLTGEDGSKKTFAYWVNKTDSNTEKVTIKADAKVFYNGVATTAYDLTDLNNLTSGSVTLLDTTRTDEYGYVFVTQYQNMVVDNVSLPSFRVTDKYNLLSLTLDPDDKSIKFSITKDGEKIGLEDLNEWDILSVAMNGATVAESTVINVLVSTDYVVGKVTEIEDGKRMINGTLYEIADNYTASGQPEIGLSDEGTFYLDVEGKIAAVDTTTAAGSNYAYLVNAEVTGSINNRLELQLFTQDGETTIYSASNRVKVNNTSNLTGEDALAAIKAANEGETAQLITYEINSSGEIYYVNTAATNSSGGSLRTAFSLDFVSGAEGIEYRSASKKLGTFNISNDTIIFDIPEGETDTENFAVRTPAMFVDKTNYNVEIYDLSEDLTAKIVIVKDSSGETNAESPIAVVTRVSSAQNSDQLTVDKLYALEDGKTIEVLAKDSVTLVRDDDTKLQAGDIVQYTKNARGEIDKVTVLFDSRDRANTDVNVYKAYAGTEMETVIGTISNKFTNSINVETSNMPVTNYNTSNAVVYDYDYTKPANSQISIVDSSYLTRYDSGDARKVFLRIYKGVVTEIVIIKG